MCAPMLLTVSLSDHPHVIPAVGKWLADHQHTFPAAQNSPHPEISATAAVGLELFGPQAASASAMVTIDSTLCFSLTCDSPLLAA